MMNHIYRSEIDQYFQSQYDPLSPEAKASAERARMAQRAGRATALQVVYLQAPEFFARTLKQFWDDDPQILEALSGLSCFDQAQALAARWRQ